MFVKVDNNPQVRPILKQEKGHLNLCTKLAKSNAASA